MKFKKTIITYQCKQANNKAFAQHEGEKHIYIYSAIEVQFYKEHFSSTLNDTEVSFSIYKQK